MKKTNKWEFAGKLDIYLRGGNESYIDVGNESVTQVLFDLDQRNIKITIESTEEA